MSRPPPHARRADPLLLAIALLAFVSLGLPDGVLGVAWPSIRAAFDLPVSQLGSLLATAMLGYLVSSALAGAAVRRLGVGRLLLASSSLVVVSMLGHAAAPAWWTLVALGAVTGLGAGAIDAGINAWAAEHLSPRWVTWLHASWGVGATLGPIAMTAAVATGAGWRWGYAAIGVAIACLAMLFLVTTRAWGDAPTATATPSPTTLAALRSRGVALNAALFFVYAGVEIGAGQWAFSVLTDSRGWDTAAAGTAVACYWAGLTAGRVAFGATAHAAPPLRLLRIGLAGAAASAAGFWLLPVAGLDAAALVTLGFFLAPIYPLLMAETPGRVGAHVTPHAVGFQVAAAYLGAAALPGLAGVLAKHLGLESVGAYLFATACTLATLHELAARRASTAPRPT